MKAFLITSAILLTSLFSIAQYDNSERFQVLAGFVSTGSDYVFWSDNTYGGNLQLVYDVKKIQEGAIGLKFSGAFANGYQGYYGGLNLRIGSHFFGDFDILFGYSSVNNVDLLKSYGPNATDFSGGAFVGNLGIGYRFTNNPLFIRLAYGAHTPIGKQGLNTAFYMQLGFRIK